MHSQFPPQITFISKNDFTITLGLEIDRRNGIELERFSKDRNTGTAFVEIKNAADFEIALKADLRDTSR